MYYTHCVQLHKNPIKNLLNYIFTPYNVVENVAAVLESTRRLFTKAVNDP